jgi:hypothetical protein
VPAAAVFSRRGLEPRKLVNPAWQVPGHQGHLPPGPAVVQVSLSCLGVSVLWEAFGWCSLPASLLEVRWKRSRSTFVWRVLAKEKLLK